MWLTVVYLLHTFGELCLSPVGLSAMTKLAPARIAGLMMGVWFLADLGRQLHRRAARRLLRIDAAADAVHQRRALRHRRRADPARAVAADQTPHGRSQLTEAYASERSERATRAVASATAPKRSARVAGEVRGEIRQRVSAASEPRAERGAPASEREVRGRSPRRKHGSRKIQTEAQLQLDAGTCGRCEARRRAREERQA